MNTAYLRSHLSSGSLNTCLTLRSAHDLHKKWSYKHNVLKAEVCLEPSPDDAPCGIAPMDCQVPYQALPCHD